MYKKFNQLSFVIGLFFAIVSVILLGNNMLTDTGSRMNLYTALVFLVFGVAMMLVPERKS